MLPAVAIALATVMVPYSSSSASPASPLLETGRTVTFVVPQDGDTLILAAPPGHTLNIRFEASQGWGDWIPVSSGLDEAPDSADGDGDFEGGVTDRVALGPVRVGDGVKNVEVSSPASGGLDRIEAIFLKDQAAGGPPRVAGNRQSRDSTKPPIMPRAAWADAGWSYDTSGCKSGPRQSSNIQAMIIHHTVNTNDYSQGEVDDLLRAIYFAHVHVNGWCDVGYNFFVDRFGTIWEGRSGGADNPIIGGHAKGFNTSTVGVAMLGQHHPSAKPEAVRPSDATETAIEHLAAWKLAMHGVDPAGTTWLRNRSSSGKHKLEAGEFHLVRTVLGHQDVGLTACPGHFGLETVRGLAEPLAQKRDTSVPYDVAQWSPATSGPGLLTVDKPGGLRSGGSLGLPGSGSAGEGSELPVLAESVTARSVAAVRSGGTAEGYVLDSTGDLHPFGGAPTVTPGEWADESPIEVDIKLVGIGSADIEGGWVVTAEGGVYGFNGAADLPVGSGGMVVAGDLSGEGVGYLLEQDGGLRSVAGASPASVDLPTGVTAIDVAIRSTGGGWVLGSDNEIYGFGGASDQSVNTATGPGSGRTATGLVAAMAGNGGWVVTTDGHWWPYGSQDIVLPVRTDATSANVVDAVVVASTVPESFFESRDGKYVRALLDLFLGQTVESTDEQYLKWSATLLQGAKRQEITEELASSPEWAGRQVDKMYLDVLGRKADDEGKAYWVSRIASGMRLQELGVHFYGSAEYYSQAGGADKYVAKLYSVLLERQPDPGGLKFWANKLESGTSPDGVAGGFYDSVESRRQRATGLYHEVLQRDPDPAGIEFWAQKLLTVDDVSLAAHLAASDEFYRNASQ